MQSRHQNKEAWKDIIFRIFNHFICINIWDKVFKDGPSKICGRQPLKNLKGYGLLKQTISLQIH